ncbi:IS1 family transposase [Trichocoleus desertorum GB2-A4]|uniref:IS1 family transposase n=1 Tax=Trichocoleus desertorum GB2-A4 TaxID=2933944 RepID=A0ABV0JDD5_9CYAN|nr:IS1 family transposase [Trichocoleus sp. FACHB-46]
MPLCPDCTSERTVKNGHIHTGKQRYLCRTCGRQFVENPTNKTIDTPTRELIDRLLLERLSMAGIARAVQVSEQWLQDYVTCKAAQTPTQATVRPKKRGPLTVQCDELWSFVDHKGNKQWVWLALDADTRELIGAHVGDRSAQSAQRLWDVLPTVYRQCAVIYTDAWEAYQQVLPRKRHRVVSKSSGKTSYIERFNNTLRQRVSRFVRRSLAFSKSLRNHIGLLWNFIHHYNASLPL